MIRKHTLTLIAVLTSVITFSQPKHFRVMWGENPANEITIGFSQELISLQNGNSFRLLYSENDHGTNAEAYLADNDALEVAREELLYQGQNHYFFRLENLKPKTAYHFIIEYTNLAGTVSYTDKYWTKTSSDSPFDPVSIIAGGDSRLNVDGGPIATLESITIRQEANKMVAKLRPDAVAFGGDYTFANTPIEWMQWFTDWELTYTEDNKITPIIAAIGNHEHSPWGCPQCGNDVVYKLFDTPHPDNYYATSIGGNLLRVYSLNTEMAITGEQTDWLAQDLANNRLNTYWKMAQYHKPMRPHEAGKSDMNEAFDNWAQLFYDEQVRLVVECDAHVVKSTHQVIPSLESDGTSPCGTSEAVDHNFFRTYNGKGTVYIGEGTWAAIREGDDPKAWTREMGSINQIKWIWVFQDHMEVRTVQTYFAEDAEYVNNVEALTELNRFTEPNGISLWGEEKVQYVYNNGLTPNPDPCARVSVKELNAKNKLVKIVPNPSKSHKLSVYFTDGRIGEVNWEVINAEGKLIKSGVQKAEQNELELNLTNEKAGVYYFKVLGKNSTASPFILE